MRTSFVTIAFALVLSAGALMVSCGGSECDGACECAGSECICPDTGGAPVAPEVRAVRPAGAYATHAQPN